MRMQMNKNNNTLANRLTQVAITLIAVGFLSACGSGVEGTNAKSAPTTDKPEAGSNWDQMHWDKGKWQ